MAKKSKPPKRKAQKAPGVNTPSPAGGVSAEDAALWNAVAESVDPLDTPARDAAPDLAPVGSAASETKAKSVKRSKPARKPRAAPLTPPPMTDARPEMKHGAAPGLDNRTAQRMRRGQVAVEGVLDLHGETQTHAYGALIGFIERSQEAGRRAVLVITGKGTRTDGRIGVLRTMVPHWLNEAPCRDRVRAFSHAAPKDGGEGALYVLLKRLK